MDCDDVMLVLASSEHRTMTGIEEARFRGHLDTCDGCRTVVDAQDEADWRWLVRIPEDAVEGPELLALPMVDPIVFVTRNEIASGGMGRITRAFDRRLGREVAVKEILSHDLRARFEREVRITARLQHPAIVPIYEAGSFPDGTTFYAMRLVSGRTLHEAVMAASTLRDRLALLPHVRAVTDAVAYAHARGVIHRDLKPGNVLVGDFGETVVIDWGLAKEDGDGADQPGTAATSVAPELTLHGTVIGTPCFMSPEQAAGEPAGATDDVYALGAILYTVLAGVPPYLDQKRDATAVVAATIDGPPTSLDELAADAPEDLRAIVARAMARQRAARFPTAKELADELARFETGQLLQSRSYSLGELLVRWVKRHRRAVALGALATIAIALFAIMWVRAERAEAELALRARGAKVTALYGEVARQAYGIDRELLRLETALEGLASAAAWALVGPEPPEELAPIYFAEGTGWRPALAKNTSYRWPVSVDHPVVSVAPNVPREPLLPKIRRLSPLRHHIREMVLEAAVAETTKVSEADATALLLARKSPIDYAYVDLAEGIHVVWPGMASLRRNYDVRTASFYQQSKNRRGTRWGAPYVDSTTDPKGDDLVLPCTRGVWSPSGTFLGVAGVEMTVTKLVDTRMTMPSRTTIRTSLVDKDGRKVIDSRDAGKLFPASGLDEAIALEPFDLPDIAAAIQNKQEGIRETTRDGRPIVVAFVRLDAIKWYYVVEVEAASLGAR
ncbi:MAG TPA: serine/threonine protein kinase [Kofleriaceae bacterium]